MELNSIKDAFDRVTKKQKLSSSKSQEIIEQIGQEIEQALSRIQSGKDSASPSDHKLIERTKAKLKEIAPLSQLEGTQKDLNIALSKYPKLLDKSFNPDISKAYRNIDFDIHTVNQIIASHFYRQGQFDLGDCFVDECHEPEAAERKAPFLEMFQILEAMKSRNLEPALNWATNNHEQLSQNGSDIELKLHRLQFVEILQNKGRDEALSMLAFFGSICCQTYG
ncbi:UNVERIFIED_CONTAM: protein RMD5 [Sesamum latifolium]|uniref:Protein RMD5 n=1 Tax=Sesamum latifolium TaxID=2727402 RepID=A0AAW2X7T0_9LAMI